MPLDTGLASFACARSLPGLGGCLQRNESEKLEVNMCLPLRPYKVEREWKHNGLSCAVVMGREAGSRCGYVRVPPNHPLHGKHYNDVYDVTDLQVHGGLTFAEIEPCTEHEDGQGWWFGFDCAHAGDAMYDPDVEINQLKSKESRSVLKIIRDIEGKYPRGHEHYWTEAEVVAETKRLAEQLAGISK